MDAVGIGPAGIVVATHTEFDQFAFIESVLGPNWCWRQCRVHRFQNGIVSLGSRDGKTASINLADTA